MALNVVLLLTTLLIISWIERYFWHGPWTFTHAFEAVVMTAGLSLGSIARLQLGSAFSLRAKAQRLITTGLYRKIRNPIYVFGAVGIVGLFLFDGMPWLLLVLLVIVPMQVIRIKNEERVLHQAFGEEYEIYKAQTWF